MVATLGLGIAACRGERQAPAPIAEAPRWTGTATDWIPADAAAWIAIDLQGLRQVPELSRLLPSEGSGLDGVSRAVVRADELVFYWNGSLLTERVAVLRGPIDRAALLDALRSSTNFTGSSFELLTSGSHQVWKARVGDWTVADPWPDVVLAGDLSAVLARLGTTPTPGSSAAGAGNERALARGHLTVSPVHLQLLSRSERLRPIAPLLAPIERIEVALLDEADPRAVLRIPVGADADTSVLIALIEALLGELLATPDDGRPRAQPGFASRVEDEAAGRVVITEVVVPRGHLVALGQLLADEGSRTRERIGRIGEIPASADGSGGQESP